MNAYFSYLNEMLNQIFTNLGLLFTGRGDIVTDFVTYHQVFAAHAGSFGPDGWILFILMLLFLIGIVAALGLLVYFLIF